MPRTKTKEKSVKIEPKKIEADAPVMLPELEEKPVDDDVVPVAGEEEEESEEAPTLDDEELNPFGDKWEQ